MKIECSSSELWQSRRARVFCARLERAGRDGLYLKFLNVPSLSSETANFMVAASEGDCVLLAEYFVAFPDEALRLCYLDPAEQEGELRRIVQDIGRS